MKKNYLSFFKKECVKQNRKELTRSIFFTENNVNGYLSKEELDNYLRPMTSQQGRHLDMALANIQVGCYLNNNIEPKFNSNDGEEVLWLRFSQPKREMSPISVPFNKGIQRFFVDYQRGITMPNFTLEDLMTEAGLLNSEEEQTA